MNILLVTGPDITLREPFSSGIEAFVVTLANQLVREGHDVDVIAQDAEPTSLFNVIDLGESLLWRPTEYRQLHRYAKLDFSRYDIIHYNLFIPELYDIAVDIDVPSLLTLHSPADQPRGDTYRRLASRRDMDFIAISSRIKEQWDHTLSKDLPLIHNGIDLDRWSVKPRRGGKFLLWSGRINREKNVGAAIALAEHLDIPLKIIGRIADQVYFDTEVKPRLRGKIEYCGHATQRELLEYAHAAKAFIATAQWQEPFGLNTLEMLACGLPVIGFDSAIPADLRYPGVSIAVQSQDWRDLIQPLQTIKSTSPLQCRSFARTMNMEQMTTEYISFYESRIASYASSAQKAALRIEPVGFGVIAES